MHVDDWTVQKAYYMNLSCQTTSNCKIPIVQVDNSSRFNIYSTASTILENWMKSLEKQGFIYTIFPPRKIVTAQTWPSRVSDY